MAFCCKTFYFDQRGFSCFRGTFNSSAAPIYIRLHIVHTHLLSFVYITCASINRSIKKIREGFFFKLSSSSSSLENVVY